MARTPAEALAYARAHINTAPGMCQKESRIAYGVPSDGTPSAAADWFGADYRHPMTSDTSASAFKNVPQGALLRWTGGSSGAGHVALYDGLENGVPMMLSTDLPFTGRRGRVPVALARQRWGLRFVGWTEDIDGVRVVRPPAPAVPVASTPVKTKPSPTPVAPVIHAAPPRKVFHDDTRIRTGGGVVSDSRVAARLASAKHYEWIDNDLHVTHRTRAGRLMGSKDVFMVPVVGHGAPFNPDYLKGKRYEEVSLQEVHGMIRMANNLKRNAHHGLGTEIEIKDLRGYAGPQHLAYMFGVLAQQAAAAYGTGWRKHVTIKVLSNLSGKAKYALKILKAAHAAGFKTMFLARGYWVTHRLPASAAEYVTWVRGARPGLYPKA